MQVVVVLSGSMEPGFYRGDILFLNMGHNPVRVGEVVVFNLDNRDIPIVHRVIKVHETEPGGEIKILTKVWHSLCTQQQCLRLHVAFSLIIKCQSTHILCTSTCNQCAVANNQQSDICMHKSATWAFHLMQCICLVAGWSNFTSVNLESMPQT